MPGIVDLGRFRFQSLEVPFHRSELLVLVPEAREAELAVEARNAAPSLARRSVEIDGGAYVELSFRADKVPRLGAEPHSRSMLDELPMVKVHTPLPVGSWLDALAVELRSTQRSNPELRQLARELTADLSSTRDKVAALRRWVVEEIESEGELGTPATLTLSGRRGNQLSLLRAMFEAVGIDSELWLLRDRFGPTVHRGGDPLIESYDNAMLAVLEPDREPLLVSVGSEVVPLGYLAQPYAGGRGLRLRLEADEPEPGYVDVPANPEALRDARRWTLSVELDEAGDGRVRGELELSGVEAMQWRGAFEQFDADRLPEVFTQAELGRMLPGASLDLDKLEFEHKQDTERPLVIRFSAHARNVGVFQSGRLAIPAAAVPIDQARGFTSLPRRWSGLVIPYSPLLEAEVRITLSGRSFAQLPPDVELRGERGSYRRTLTRGGVGEREIVLESRSTLVPGVVEVDAYDELAAFAAKVTAAEGQLLDARRPAASGRVGRVGKTSGHQPSTSAGSSKADPSMTSPAAIERVTRVVCGA